MYITLSNITNRKATPLNPALDNGDGDLEIVLSEILYLAWMNISNKLHNDWFLHGKQKNITVPDILYYYTCILYEQVFSPLNLKLTLNPAMGLASVSDTKVNFDGIWSTFGFINLVPYAADGAIIGEKFS